MVDDYVPALDPKAAMRSQLATVIAFINEKGGVGKTSLTSNLAGHFADADYRVLIVDLNRQANILEDFGCRDDKQNDGVNDKGHGLLTSLIVGPMGGPLKAYPIPGRNNIWLVPGGEKLAEVVPVISARHASQDREDIYVVLAQLLAPLAAEFDIVLIDVPPESPIVEDLALAAARWVVIPTKSDAGGVRGMSLVARRFKMARAINPDLELMGVALFASGLKSTSIREDVIKQITEAFGGVSPMFDTFIRHSELVAVRQRKEGKLAHELEMTIKHRDAAKTALNRENRKEAKKAAKKAAEQGDGDSAAKKKRPRIPPSVGVSHDYFALAGEIIDVLEAAMPDDEPDGEGDGSEVSELAVSGGGQP